jgi:hypothetical protein
MKRRRKKKDEKSEKIRENEIKVIIFCHGRTVVLLFKAADSKEAVERGGGERACESTSPSLRAHRPRRELCYFSPNAIGFCFHIASVNVFS